MVTKDKMSRIGNFAPTLTCKRGSEKSHSYTIGVQPIHLGDASWSIVDIHITCSLDQSVLHGGGVGRTSGDTLLAIERAVNDVKWARRRVLVMVS